MKKQAMNPFLPLSEYVPDGEPRIFGNRLYLYGSHDRAGATEFCVNDYVVYSAPVDDLSDWSYEGVSYSYEASLHSLEEVGNLAAPDCVQGHDGRYYLYYNRGKRVECEVAVSDSPQGPFEFFSEITYADGTKPNMKLFDPGILIDDDGKIYLYTGFVPTPGSPWINIAEKYSQVFELEQDMHTIKNGPYELLPGCLAAKGTEYENHGFYEASSPRKINGKYYLVYSSELSHDLCYAVSDNPIKGFRYGGILVSNADIGYKGNQIAKAPYGNTHGGLVNVNGVWYIFYHRQTHGIECCRQACAEIIELTEEGQFIQAEITSYGLNQSTLKGIGTYNAAYACNLVEATPWNEKLTIRKCVREEHVHIFEEKINDTEMIHYIANAQSGTVAGFKYFDLKQTNKIQVTVRSNRNSNSYGCVDVFCDEECIKKVACIPFEVGKKWLSFSSEFTINQADAINAPLFFRVDCSNAIDWLEFELL